MIINKFPTELIITDIEGRDIENSREVIFFGGHQGLFSRQEWINDLIEEHCFTKDQAEEICNILETCSNEDFFAK